jgi:HPt (histidine-containing phosphotransfer) domain-containing protein
MKEIERNCELDPEAKPGLESLPVDVLDWAAALKSVGGDRAILREMVAIFLKECPRWLAEVRQAVARENGNLLRRVAHTIKGASVQFGAHGASTAALRLETMGQDGVFAGAQEACACLESELQRLEPAFAQFAGQQSG